MLKAWAVCSSRMALRMLGTAVGLEEVLEVFA